MVVPINFKLKFKLYDSKSDFLSDTDGTNIDIIDDM
jgi:hypothetical protein